MIDPFLDAAHVANSVECDDAFDRLVQGLLTVTPTSPAGARLALERAAEMADACERPHVDVAFEEHIGPLLAAVATVERTRTLGRMEAADMRTRVQAILEAAEADWTAGGSWFDEVAYVIAVGRWAALQPRPVVEPLR